MDENVKPLDVNLDKINGKQKPSLKQLVKKGTPTLDLEKWDVIMSEVKKNAKGEVIEESSFFSETCVSEDPEQRIYFINLLCAGIDEVAKDNVIVYDGTDKEDRKMKVEAYIESLKKEGNVNERGVPIDELGFEIVKLYKPEKPYLIRFGIDKIQDKLNIKEWSMDKVMFAFASTQAYSAIKVLRDFKLDELRKEYPNVKPEELKEIPVTLNHVAYVVVRDPKGIYATFGGPEAVSGIYFKDGLPGVYFQDPAGKRLEPVSLVTFEEYTQFVFEDNCKVTTSYMSESDYDTILREQGMEKVKKLMNHNFVLFVDNKK
jgi:hypothetical protein